MSRADKIREAFAGSHGAHWHSTDAYSRAVWLGAGLVAAGMFLHQVELVLFGVPLVLSVLITNKPKGTPTVSVRPVPRGEGAGVVHTVAHVDGADAELAVVKLPGGPKVVPVHSPDLPVEIRRDAWGPGVDVRLDHLFAGPDGMHVYGPIVGTEHVRTILPPVEHHPAGPLPPRPAGLVGIHRSPRAGDSTELRDIRAFQPGDRLKRIDWRVTTRTGTVHVRERHAEADAEIVLALDTRTDLSAKVAEWSSPHHGATTRPGGSLDRAVRRAASMAAGYLRQGDRVALMDLSRPQLNVRSGVGRRHLMRIRTQLVVCVQAAGWASRVALRKLPHGSVVVLLSPFLDDEIAELAVQTRKHGHVVLAINTLPLPLEPDEETPWGEVAAELIAAEHRLRLRRMAEHGVAVTTEC
ncbi:DUF58 domain-containing protein [Lentzea aerocolonigenes]|uniref:DUF58 domain-containing protein n=1 Tax=Lentzea aerocolonigenes TaxID=68170 RepID=UPI00068C6F88|nr:DUF58 domain-containing protein [Lentzea aerocolonigenes]MCP2246186.1 Uncharacterized conserved protein, DUF58 family, contains vWF domain [Lentzea aerocolonigenes]